MFRFDRIDEIIEHLLKTGSSIPYLEELREQSIELVKHDRDLKEVLFDISKGIEEVTKQFLDEKNEYGTSLITGISTGIYLPDYENNGEYKYTIVGGTSSRDRDDKITEDTLFDVASISKLFTLVLLLKLEELHLIDLNTKVKDINPDIQGLEDFTLNDLVKLHGQLYTNGRIDDVSSPEEAYERLKSVYLKSNTREKNTYTDIGAMIIADTIEKVISSALGKKMNYEEIMSEFLFKPLFIRNTTFTPGIIQVAGNANNLGLPHDPKARAFGRPSGHAGVFTNSEDLSRLAHGLLVNDYLSKEHVDKLGEITFEGSTKGNLGMYVKGEPNSTFTPQEFSDGSFSMQGWTGQVAMFDPNNKIHSSILVNAIENTDDKSRVKNDKPIEFAPKRGAYQREIIKKIMLMYIAKKYYNKYLGVKEDITQSVKVM